MNDKPKKVWVTRLKVEISRLEGIRSVAIVMNAATFNEATDIDYFITNLDPNIVNEELKVMQIFIKLTLFISNNLKPHNTNRIRPIFL